MDTRQLAAFCAVVERHSFSQAAERLGVTQPAVSLQVRALEKRLGTQLLDRSGRRVEPTEAGRRLYRGAQRLLALEEQVLEDVVSEADGRPHRRALDRRLDRPRGGRRAAAPLRVPARASRGAGRARGARHAARSSTSSPNGGSSSASSAHHRATAACGSSPSRTTRSSSSARPGTVSPAARSRCTSSRDETLVVMQEGAGVRRIVEDELRRLGVRLRDLDVRLELGLQESVRSAVLGGYGVTFISRAAVESDLASGALAEARVEGMDGRARSRSSAAPARVHTRAARRSSISRASGWDASSSASAPPRPNDRDATVRIIRFGAGALAELGRRLRRSGDRGAAARHDPPRRGAGGEPSRRRDVRRRPAARPVETVREAATRARELGADGLVGLGGGSAIDTCKAVVAELAARGTSRSRASSPCRRRTQAPSGRRTSGCSSRRAGRAAAETSAREPVAAIYDPELSSACRSPRRSGPR